jgi:hypothetical protein
VAFLWIGCASTSGQRAPDTPPLALILATDAYELHLEDGRLYKVAPVAAADAPLRQQVATWDEFAGLYDVKQATVLETVAPERKVEVNGWQGLECVRKGHMCGRATEPAGRGDAVRVRLVFVE